VFRNIEVWLGYNIMTLEHVSGLMWQENAKNVWKKFKTSQNQHFLGGDFLHLVFRLKCFFQESGVHFWNLAPMIIKIFFCVFGSIRRYGTKKFWIFDHFWEIYGPSQKKILPFFVFWQKWGFFRGCDFCVFLGVFFRWCTV